MAFSEQNFIQQSARNLKEKVQGPAIAAASGGVDSTTACALLHSAVGELQTPVFVDTGLMRKGERDRVSSIFSELGIPLRVVDASEQFFNALRGVSDPEQKRKAIGEAFIRVFEKEAGTIGAKFLVQGTIAPDWIESGSGKRDVIKSHHNVGGLPERMGLRLVEPLRDLYKDEVRKVAAALGVPESSWSRQPFPGPGLAIRVLGEVTPERAAVVREACAIVEQEFEAASEKGEMRLPWQYFAVLLPVRSVGVQGDKRAYGNTIAIRAVESLDGMTASFARIPHEVLQRVAERISNALKDQVNRVVFDVTNKPPGTIEWE